MKYCEMFSALALGYTLCFKLIGPNVVSTENTCFFTLIGGRFFGDISHDKGNRLKFAVFRVGV